MIPLLWVGTGYSVDTKKTAKPFFCIPRRSAFLIFWVKFLNILQSLRSQNIKNFLPGLAVLALVIAKTSLRPEEETKTR